MLAYTGPMDPTPRPVLKRAESVPQMENPMFRLLAPASVAMFALLCRQACAQERGDIMPVCSGHPVGFGLLTHGSRRVVAFHDADR
ncbi:MAG: hypothetical protein KatS3mg024_0116 [Armatimonadota bacterium]|nr:MAG: hypothetical protein KatS3mg024_0116 [Armatimonadota bacterium]